MASVPHVATAEAVVTARPAASREEYICMMGGSFVLGRQALQSRVGALKV